MYKHECVSIYFNRIISAMIKLWKDTDKETKWFLQRMPHVRRGRGGDKGWARKKGKNTVKKTRLYLHICVCIYMYNTWRERENKFYKKIKSTNWGAFQADRVPCVKSPVYLGDCKNCSVEWGWDPSFYFFGTWFSYQISYQISLINVGGVDNFSFQADWCFLKKFMTHILAWLSTVRKVSFP